MIDLVDLGVIAVDDVVEDELEAVPRLAVDQMLDVLASAGADIVEADHVVALGDEPTGARCNECAASS